MEEPTRYRYCPACGEEFRPDIERCSDCGGALEDRYEGMTTVEDDAAEVGDPGPAPVADGAEFVPLYTTESSAEADGIARRLARAAIAYTVTTGRRAYAFTLNVPEASLEAAKAYVPREEAAVDGFDHEKGYERCPACGQGISAEAAECPGCGLVLSGSEDDSSPKPPPGDAD